MNIPDKPQPRESKHGYSYLTREDLEKLPEEVRARFYTWMEWQTCPMEGVFYHDFDRWWNAYFYDIPTYFDQRMDQ